MASLNGNEIIVKFEAFVDDTLDADLELQLVNDAKDEIEAEVGYAPNSDVDESKSTTSGQTSSVAKALPTDFLSFSKPYIYVGTYKFYQVPFADKAKFQDSPYKFYYDPADGIHLCGEQNSVQTISIPYIKQTDDLTLATTPVWPRRFHSLIPMWMASIFYPIEAGEPARSWTPQWEGRFQRLLGQFRDWSMKQKLSAAGGRTNYRDNDADNQGIPLSEM